MFCSNHDRTNNDKKNVSYNVPTDSFKSNKIFNKKDKIKIDPYIQKLINSSKKYTNKDSIFFSKYPNCSKMIIKRKIYDKIMDNSDTTNNSLKKFYLKYPEICGREISVILYVNHECEIIGHKIRIFNPSNDCQTFKDYEIVPKIENEYKLAFNKWLNGLIDINSQKICEDTFFYYYSTRIGDR